MTATCSSPAWTTVKGVDSVDGRVIEFEINTGQSMVVLHIATRTRNGPQLQSEGKEMHHCQISKGMERKEGTCRDPIKEV
jgi:hypothetical protein